MKQLFFLICQEHVSLRFGRLLETWLSNERDLSKGTPRFLIDDEDLTEQPSSHYALRFLVQ